MPRAHAPRRGSLQFWPRKRARRILARVRTWALPNDVKPAGFAGYKVAMAHATATNNTPDAMTKGEKISVPITIVECPPIKIASVILYKKFGYGVAPSNQILSKSLDKELRRKIPLPKKEQKTSLENININDYVDVKALIYTQPKLTGIGKKKPEVFELALGGSLQDKFNWIKEHINKEIRIGDIFKEGQLVDIHAVTKGKGYQGPVKRFGVNLRSHKAEKTKRGPGSLGGWMGQQHFMWRVAHAGKMGFHQRTEYNKMLLKISNDKTINPRGGFLRYGLIDNDYVLVKGSVMGPAKRILILTQALRPTRGAAKESFEIERVIMQ